MADARQELQLYVAGGSLRNADTPESHIAIQQERMAMLGNRLAQWRGNMGRVTVTPEAAPADFRAALEEADQRAYQRSLTEQGRDIPRLEPQNPTAAKIVNRVYQAHDTVVGLPTPAGLGVLILIIVVLFLILIPATARGETRMLLLWDVVLGRKVMPGTSPAPAGPATSDIFTPQSVASAAAGGVLGVTGVAGALAQQVADTAVNPQNLAQDAANTAWQLIAGLGDLP